MCLESFASCSMRPRWTLTASPCCLASGRPFAQRTVGFAEKVLYRLSTKDPIRAPNGNMEGHWQEGSFLRRRLSANFHVCALFLDGNVMCLNVSTSALRANCSARGRKLGSWIAHGWNWRRVSPRLSGTIQLETQDRPRRWRRRRCLGHSRYWKVAAISTARQKDAPSANIRNCTPSPNL